MVGPRTNDATASSFRYSLHLVTLAQAGMPVLLGRRAANFESDLGSSAAGDVG